MKNLQVGNNGIAAAMALTEAELRQVSGASFYLALGAAADSNIAPPPPPLPK